MNQTDVINRLKQEAASNPAFNAVCHVFALRERARHQVTVQALDYRMRKEGFNFDKSQYANILKILGELGIGRVDHDRNGNVTALRDVKTTLQSIGKSAVSGQVTKLQNYNRRHTFSELAAVAEKLTGKKMAKRLSLPVAPISDDTRTTAPKVEYPVSLTVVIGGKPVNFRVPTNLSAEEIAALVIRFHDKATS